MSRLARVAWATVSGTPLATRRRRCASSATSGHGDARGEGALEVDVGTPQGWEVPFSGTAPVGDGGYRDVVGSIPGRIVVRDHDGDGDDVRVASRPVTASHLERARSEGGTARAIVVDYAGNGPRQRAALIRTAYPSQRIQDGGCGTSALCPISTLPCMMAAAAVFASNPAIQRRRPFGVSIAGRRAAIASRSAAGKADEDSGADEDISNDPGVPAARRPRATSKTLAGGDDPSLTFADHRRMCRAVRDAKTPTSALALAASSLASWDHVTLAAAFVALASNARTKSSLGTLLDSESYARMEEKAAHASVPALGARGVVNILHSVATLHQRHRRFFDRKSSTQQRGSTRAPTSRSRSTPRSNEPRGTCARRR